MKAAWHRKAFFLIGLALIASRGAAGAEPPDSDPAANAGTEQAPAAGQLLKVDSLRKKYWEKTEDSSLRVVQNRLYSKAQRIELGVFVGTISTDPFLNVKSVGGTLGYFFNEEFGVNFIYWKAIVSDSSALATLKKQTGFITNTNEPDSFYGGELSYSPIYGKLSVSGKLIVYYDFHLLCGLGFTKTETGSPLTPEVGLGQQTYLAKKTTLRLDYRLTYFKEKIMEKVVTANKGLIVGTRDTFNDVITLGITQLF
jgi:outer membrane beta-barrel protein